MTRTAFYSLRFQQRTFKDEASPENKKMATTFDLQWHQPKVTSIKRADGVEFIMHCVKYSWSTFSSIAYLLMNDKEISMRLSIHPYTNYNEVQLVSSSNPLFTWKTSAHTSFLRSAPQCFNALYYSRARKYCKSQSSNSLHLEIEMK